MILSNVTRQRFKQSLISSIGSCKIAVSRHRPVVKHVVVVELAVVVVVLTVVVMAEKHVLLVVKLLFS